MTSRVGWFGALGLLLLLVFAGGAWARPASVLTTDGQLLQGELLSEGPSEVVLEISGIRTPIPRDQIQRIQIQKTHEQEYRDRRAALEDDDLEGRYQLAYEMFQKREYELAARELRLLEERFPEAEKVSLLHTLVQERQQLEQERLRRQQIAPPADAQEPQDPPATQPEAADGPADRLTEEQINLIRVYEVDLEAQPRVHVPQETLDELFERYGGNERIPRGRTRRTAFRGVSPVEQLRLIFNVQARDLYDDVVVWDDSPALRAFRSRIHRQYVLNYCATNMCHGGEDAAGDLRLLRVQPNSDRTVYTNFFTLNRYQNEQGRMINRDAPTRSLLLQYGLGQDVAVTPHPDVPGWRPQFFSQDNPRFQRYARIIDRLWDNPPLDYGIDFTPPGAGGSQPTTPTPTEAADTPPPLPAEPAATQPDQP